MPVAARLSAMGYDLMCTGGHRRGAGRRTGSRSTTVRKIHEGRPEPARPPGQRRDRPDRQHPQRQGGPHRRGPDPRRGRQPRRPLHHHHRRRQGRRRRPGAAPRRGRWTSTPCRTCSRADRPERAPHPGARSPHHSGQRRLVQPANPSRQATEMRQWRRHVGLDVRQDRRTISPTGCLVTQRGRLHEGQSGWCH